MVLRRLVFCAFLLLPFASSGAETLTPQQQIAFDIYKELVEINTVTATGDTQRAAEAMAARLRAAGFAGSDVQVFAPAPRKGNLVARLGGTGKRKPILLLAHIDVVDARHEDWSFDPFNLTDREGYFYGRGTADNKFMAAAFVANLIRYKQEGYTPERDIVVALEADEEIGDATGVGIRWLLAHHRPLIDAEFALNEGGRVGLKAGKPLWNSVQIAEKVFVSYKLEATDRGGHSSLPTKEPDLSPGRGAGASRQVRVSVQAQRHDARLLRARRRGGEPADGVGHARHRRRSSRSRRVIDHSPVGEPDLQRATAHHVRCHANPGWARRQRAPAKGERHGQLPRPAG
jgi:hypothetical protein